VPHDSFPLRLGAWAVSGADIPQLANLSLYIGFFLIGVSIEISHWKPSCHPALGSLLVFFAKTLALTLYPQTAFGQVGWTLGKIK
jgi:hypothetical protein